MISCGANSRRANTALPGQESPLPNNQNPSPETSSEEEQDQPFQLEEKDFVKFSPRNMLVILDDSDHKPDEVSAPWGALATAFSQKVSPIVTSASIARYVLDTYKSGKIGRHMDFKESEWVIKEVSEDLILFIAHKSFPELGIRNKEDLDAATDSNEPTKLELKLGLKVNHMKTIQSDAITSNTRHSDAKYFLTSLTQKKLFTTLSEYPQPLPQDFKMPAWSLYLYGHGESGSSVVYLTINDFKDVLDFFSTKINTRMLVYTSCYSGGVTERRIYDDFSNGRKTFSFPILSQALTDAPALGGLSAYDFAQAFKESLNPEAINYAAIAEHFFINKNHIWQTEKVWGNEPLIRFPGLEWFSVLDQRNGSPNREIVQIGNALAMSRDEKRPLNVTEHWGKNAKAPKALLLYSNEVPFKLKINHPIKAIISMIPGSSTHVLEAIETNQPPADFLRSFMGIDQLHYQRVFFIKKLFKGKTQIMEDILIFHDRTKVGGMGMEKDIYTTYAAYLGGDGKFYAMKDSEKEDEADKQPRVYRKGPMYNNYMALRSKLKGEIREIKEHTFQYLSMNRIHLAPALMLSGPTKIKKVTIKEKKAQFYQLELTLQRGLKKGDVIWIDSLMVYPEFFVGDRSKTIGVPDGTTDLIELKDFVFTVQENGTYFTYKDQKFVEGNVDGHSKLQKTDKDYQSMAKQKMSGKKVQTSETSATRESLKKLGSLLKRKQKERASQ